MKTSVKRVYKRSSMLLRGILNSMTKEEPIVSLNGVVVFFFYTFVIDNSLLLSTHGVPYIYIQARILSNYQIHSEYIRGIHVLFITIPFNVIIILKSRYIQKCLGFITTRDKIIHRLRIIVQTIQYHNNR